jgi:aminopeptidase N
MHPNNIYEIFGAILYAKAASIFGMILLLIGKDNFMEGMQTCLKKIEFGNAAINNLWAALETVLGIPASNLWLL